MASETKDVISTPFNNGPWRVISRELRYSNRFGMKVYEDNVMRPDGKPGIYGWMTAKTGVSTLPIDSDGMVYLGREFQYALGLESTEIMGGGVEHGEPHIDAAKRELKEELGITSKKWTDLGRFYSSGAIVRMPQRLFMAEDLEFGPTSLELMERIQPIKMSLDEAVEKVMRGEISDGQTSVALLKAYQHIKSR